MWIDLSYKGNEILISLQSFDIDPNKKGNKNLHVLYDRIGILFEKGGANKSNNLPDLQEENLLKNHIFPNLHYCNFFRFGQIRKPKKSL